MGHDAQTSRHPPRLRNAPCVQQNFLPRIASLQFFRRRFDLFKGFQQRIVGQRDHQIAIRAKARSKVLVHGNDAVCEPGAKTLQHSKCLFDRGVQRRAKAIGIGFRLIFVTIVNQLGPAKAGEHDGQKQALRLMAVIYVGVFAPAIPKVSEKHCRIKNYPAQPRSWTPGIDTKLDSADSGCTGCLGVGTAPHDRHIVAGAAQS